jgi:putative lipoic acid-binding regulatory protein
LTQQPSALDDLVAFPALMVFRAVGPDGDVFPALCLAAVEQALGRSPTSHELMRSKQGRWMSVRVAATVTCADDVRAVFAALQAIDGVRVVL